MEAVAFASPVLRKERQIGPLIRYLGSAPTRGRTYVEPGSIETMIGGRKARGFPGFSWNLSQRNLSNSRHICYHWRCAKRCWRSDKDTCTKQRNFREVRLQVFSHLPFRCRQTVAGRPLIQISPLSGWISHLVLRDPFSEAAVILSFHLPRARRLAFVCRPVRAPQDIKKGRPSERPLHPTSPINRD